MCLLLYTVKTDCDYNEFVVGRFMTAVSPIWSGALLRHQNQRGGLRLHRCTVNTADTLIYYNHHCFSQ